MAPLTIPVLAIRIRQREKPGQAMYMAKINAKDLVDRGEERFDIREYKRIKEGDEYKDIGYQRAPNKSKVEGVKRYLLDNNETVNPLFPTAIIVSSEDPLDFEEEKDGNGFGILSLQPKLYIIDGQHRWRALSDLMKSGAHNNLADFEIPLIILSGFKEIEEVAQFHIINSKQTKIKTDLAYNHYLMLMRNQDTQGLVSNKDKWIAKANVISKTLNEKEKGVWFEKMSNANDPKDVSRNKPINISSFTSSLKTFYTENKIFKKSHNADKNTLFIKKFWDNVALVWPNALDSRGNGFNDYVLMKTIGVFSMHLLLSEMLKRHEDPDVALEECLKALKKANKAGYDDTFWYDKINIKRQAFSRITSGKYAAAYSSGSGHKQIVSLLLAA